MDKEVPTAKCVTYESLKPKDKKMKVNIGTIKIPPPTPNIPARMPAIEPAIRYEINSTNILKLFIIFTK